MKMPKGLSKMEQARFIYIELGRMVSFDEEYWFGNNTTRKGIYTSAQKVKDFKDITSNGKWIKNGKSSKDYRIK